MITVGRLTVMESGMALPPYPPRPRQTGPRGRFGQRPAFPGGRAARLRIRPYRFADAFAIIICGFQGKSQALPREPPGARAGIPSQSGLDFAGAARYNASWALGAFTRAPANFRLALYKNPLQSPHAQLMRTRLKKTLMISPMDFKKQASAFCYNNAGRKDGGTCRKKL